MNFCSPKNSCSVDSISVPVSVLGVSVIMIVLSIFPKMMLRSKNSLVLK